jgi:hypothetical protein
MIIDTSQTLKHLGELSDDLDILQRQLLFLTSIRKLLDEFIHPQHGVVTAECGL